MLCTVIISEYDNGFHMIRRFYAAIQSLDHALFDQFMEEAYGATLFDGYDGKCYLADLYDTPDDKIYKVSVEPR